MALFAEPRIHPANTWLTGLASWLKLAACVCLKCCSDLLFLWAEEWFVVSLPSLLIRCVYFWKERVYLRSTCWRVWAPAPVPWMSGVPEQEPSWGIKLTPPPCFHINNCKRLGRNSTFLKGFHISKFLLSCDWTMIMRTFDSPFAFWLWPVQPY